MATLDSTRFASPPPSPPSPMFRRYTGATKRSSSQVEPCWSLQVLSPVDPGYVRSPRAIEEVQCPTGGKVYPDLGKLPTLLSSSDMGQVSWQESLVHLEQLRTTTPIFTTPCDPHHAGDWADQLSRVQLPHSSSVVALVAEHVSHLTMAERADADDHLRVLQVLY